MANIIDNESAFLAPLDYSNLDANDKAQVDALIIACQAYLEEWELNRKLAAADYTNEKHDGNNERTIFVDNIPLNSLVDIDITHTAFEGSTTTTTIAGTEFDFDVATGEIRFKPGSFLSAPGGLFSTGLQNIHISYNGGFIAGDTRLEVVKMLIAEFVLEKFDPNLNEELIEKERIGDYFIAKHKNYLDNLMSSNKRMLNKLKLRKVSTYVP